MDRIDFDEVFENVEVESEYLKDILNDSLEIIGRSLDIYKTCLGPISEGPTSSGEVAEVTQNGLIKLNSKALQKLDRCVAMAIIAHEIAHVYLNHYKDLSTLNGNGLRHEQEADNQAREWGFDVDYFRKVYGPPNCA